MAITEQVLENLARSVDLRVEALNTPTSPGQPQDFQITPAALLLSPITSLPLSPLGGLIPTEASLTGALPVELTVTWGVEDVAGVPLESGEVVFCSRSQPTSPELDKTLQTTVMVLPDFVELTRNMVEVPCKTRYVTASVTLSVNLSTDPNNPRKVKTTLPLLRHPITVPAIPIPTVAIFFAKPTLGVLVNSDPPELQDGDQFALIVVPEDSPIASITALRAVLEKLMEITGTANKLIGLAEPLATSFLPSLTELGLGVGGIGGILRALDAHKVLGASVGVALVAADRIGNLNNLEMIRNANHWGLNDVEAEDTISSFLFLAPRGRKLRCFQNRDFKGAHVTVTTGNACLAIVNELENVPPHNVLPTNVLVKPLVEQHGNFAMNDRFSAMAFL
jgi:hypothetical protein